MISITEAISDLLYIRDTVVVPGLGAFVKKPTSANVNPVVSYFAMPSAIIEFDAALREDNVLLVSYLSEKNEIPEDEAKKLLAMFVSDCFNTLKNKKKVELNGLGTLSYDWAGDLVFKQQGEINYNSDAFGLSDFTLEPVMRSKTKVEIKAEIEQQQKDKNTPVTVDEKAVHEHDKIEVSDDGGLPHPGWLWVLPVLLLVAGVLFGMHYFKFVDFKKWFEQIERMKEPEPWTISFPGGVKPWPVVEIVTPAVTDTIASSEADTITSEKADTIASKEVDVIVPEKIDTVVPKAIDAHVEEQETVLPVEEDETVLSVEEVKTEANIRIIAGCFGQEDNAIRLVNSLKNKGYNEAFYELRGTKWYVSFGRYTTDEEAATALREIRTNTEYKAWILK